MLPVAGIKAISYVVARDEGEGAVIFVFVPEFAFKKVIPPLLAELNVGPFTNVPLLLFPLKSYQVVDPDT